MTRPSSRHLALLVVLSTALSACADMPNPFAGKGNSSQDPVTTDAAKSVRLVDRDVEAPETFQTTDTALWDGRPSLGGVWVASPDAVNPERVILRNGANGKFVIGALFRRERDNPGPKLQISSDAAEALGMLAGQPGKLNVTALRREDSSADAASAKPETIAEAQQGDVEAAAVDPLAAAGAAIDRADGVEAADVVTALSAPSDDLDPTPRPGETKRAARKRARAAARAASEAKATGQAMDGIVPQDGLAPLAAPVEALEVATLPAANIPAVAVNGDATRVQIGIFSVEANAKRAADKLKAGGVSADVRKEESNGKSFWSVVASGDGGKAFLKKVQGLGFADAYVVSG